ncbi:MarR family winged helix-turn-helix transcriptional regulator (plasmid) [Streptomyces sp. CA-294286]|uniref:MarR family winged helix-turn-helix transcriptional regulator n=1 Tax=Streptomyces sp. CA-294286 TaxID=3240070 RepID=UPI003D90E01A
MASTNERDPERAAAPDRAPAPPPGEPVPDLLAFAVQLRRMNGEIGRLAHGFATEQGLHPTDVQALAAILDSDTPLTPGRLREHLGLTSGAVTACLDRLEKAGHVRRSRDSKDRRVVHLHYETSARSVARAHFLPLATATENVRSRFEPAELSLVLRFLTELNTELSELPAPRR